jgi:FkbM family methyltransferase
MAMISIGKKLSWRLRFFLEGLSTTPLAFFDSGFWKILLQPSEVTFKKTPVYRITQNVFEVLKNSFFTDGVFSFPLNYYGKRFTLYFSDPNDDFFGFILEFFDLLFPYFEEKAKEKLLPFVEDLKKQAYPGMAYEFNKSLFKSMYLLPQKGLIWGDEGEYDNSFTHLREGEWVVDVGANIGLFTVLAGKAVGENGRVYAFEPLEELRKKLLVHVTLNGLKNIIVVPKALGDKNTEVTMDGIEIKREGEGVIKCITLDTWAKETNLKRFDFLKMDVEGFERKVLTGGTEALRAFCPRMGICIYHLLDDPEVLKSLILEIDPEYRIWLNSTKKKYLVGRKI